MNAVFTFIKDVETGTMKQLVVPADTISERFENGQTWFVAWKGEWIVAMVNAQYIVSCYLM